jgi:hypothetical protein
MFPYGLAAMNYAQTVVLTGMLQKQFNMTGVVHFKELDTILFQISPTEGWKGCKPYCENIYITYSDNPGTNLKCGALYDVWFDMDDGFVKRSKDSIVDNRLQEQFSLWQRLNFQGPLFPADQFGLAAVKHESPRSSMLLFPGKQQGGESQSAVNLSSPRNGT